MQYTQQVHDPLEPHRRHFLALAANIPARCRLVELSEGNSFTRKLRKLNAFGTRYLLWAMAQAGLSPGTVEFPLFWGDRVRLSYKEDADFVTFYLTGAPGGPEYKLARYLIKTLKSDDCFYDAGANYGFFTLLAAQLIGDQGALHAFEPLPNVYQWLKGNVRHPPAHLIDAALWDTTGAATLYRHHLSDAFNTLEAAAADPDQAANPVTTQVRCITLDDYAAINRPPTVLKIDVEGGEKRLIAGAVQTLRSARPAIAMEIWAGANGKRFSLPACQSLIELGYMVFSLNEEGVAISLDKNDLMAFIESLPTTWDNLLFLPNR